MVAPLLEEPIDMKDTLEMYTVFMSFTWMEYLLDEVKINGVVWKMGTPT